MPRQPKDIPLLRAIKQADNLVKQGYAVYQKFTCAHCHQRLTIDVPNQFHRSGTCDKCGHTTDIHRCGYMVVGTGIPLPYGVRNEK